MRAIWLLLSYEPILSRPLVQGISAKKYSVLEVAGNNLNFCPDPHHAKPYTFSISSREFSVKFFFKK